MKKVTLILLFTALLFCGVVRIQLVAQNESQYAPSISEEGTVLPSQLSEADAEILVTKVYRLKNTLAADVAKVINNYITEKQRIIANTPGGVSEFQLSEEALTVTSEATTNSVIIETRRGYLKEITKMIEHLDQLSPPVEEGILQATLTPDPDYVELLKKRIEVAKAKADLIQTRVNVGGQGGNVQALCVAQIAQAETEADFYLYTGEREKLIYTLCRKVEAARQLVNTCTQAYNTGNAMIDDVQEAELILAEAEFELKKARDNNTTKIYAPQRADADADGYVTIPARDRFRYDNQTFWQWKEQAETELNPERHVEIVKAFGAFARKGFGKEATEAILKMLEDDYPGFHVTTIPLNIENFHRAVTRAFSSSIPVKDSVPILLERYETSPESMKDMILGLLRMIVNTRSIEQLREQLADSPEVLALFDALAAAEGEPSR